MDEYVQVKKEFPNVVFMGDGQAPDKNKWLFLIDGYTVYPQSYNVSCWKLYKGIITWNSKLYDMYKDQFKMILCNGFPCFNDYAKLEIFKPFEERLDAIMLACRHRGNSSLDGDIAYRRLEVMQNIYNDKRLEAHCYGISPYGEFLYRGSMGRVGTEETFPSSLQKLQVLNKYKFNLAFENCYHELWSWDWMTEKIRDAMKAKTVAIYYGAYNIEQIVPDGLYIDYRKFSTDIELVDKLVSISKNEYEDITEKAYEWTTSCELGNIEKFKQILGGLE